MNSRERVRRAFHFDKPDTVPMSCINLKTDFFPIIQFHSRTWQPKDFPSQGQIKSEILNFKK